MEEIITLKQIKKVISKLRKDLDEYCQIWYNKDFLTDIMVMTKEQKSNYINNFQYLCENRLLNWYKIGAILEEDDSIYFFKLED
jgi:hypothetical protein